MDIQRTVYIERFVRVMKADTSWLEKMPPQARSVYRLVMEKLETMPPDVRERKYNKLLRGIASNYVDGQIAKGWTPEMFETALTVIEQGAGL